MRGAKVDEVFDDLEVLGVVGDQFGAVNVCGCSDVRRPKCSSAIETVLIDASIFAGIGSPPINTEVSRTTRTG